MRRWRAADVTAFLTAKDLAGPAEVLFKNGVAGKDFETMNTAIMKEDLRLSAFAADKIVAVRAEFLA